MKIFSYNKDNDPEMPDWQWGFLCFKPLDILTVKLYKMKQYTWKECFNFGVIFFDYSLLEFTFTVGNYDGLITLFNFSGSRSLNHEEMNLEALLKVIFSGYEGEFYPTGSEVYGYPNELSDYDFMVLDPEGNVRGRLVARLEELGTEVETSNYFNCIKFPIMDKVINLIFLNDKNYTAWMKATAAMKAMKKFHEDHLLPYNPLADKRLRCILFQELVAEFGGDDVGLVYETRSNVQSLENLDRAVRAVERDNNQLLDPDEDIPF